MEEMHKKRTNRETLPHAGVFARLRPSKIHGVGVFAIRDIPNGTYIFTRSNSNMVMVDICDIEVQEPAIKELYDDFCIIHGSKYYCPDSFNNLNVEWYLNESKENPNVKCDANFDFYALRDIRRDEELTVDYSTFSEYPQEQ
jgi:SET domain-containing protein